MRSQEKKRRIERRRFEIAANAKATLAVMKQGTAKTGNINDLIADLLDGQDDLLLFYTESSKTQLML